MAEHKYTLTKLTSSKYLIIGDQEPPTRVEFEARFAPEYLSKWMLIEGNAEVQAILQEVERDGKAERTINWGKFFQGDGPCVR